MAAYRWRWWFAQSREALWPLISDTDWINKHSGLPPVRYKYLPVPAGGSLTQATIALGPLEVRWIEPPFEWSEPEYYSVERRYLSGPLARFWSRTELRPADGGTVIDVSVELEARNRAFAWILPVVAWYGRRGAHRAFTTAAAAAQETGQRSGKHRQLVGREALRAAGFGDALLDKLAAFLDFADDRELAKIRPYEVADRWNESRKTVLQLFLTAVRAGILNLSWEVMCPNCRGTKQNAQSLDRLTQRVHCDACNIGFGPEFDRSVEVTFDAHPLGKGLDVPSYCLAGPHTSRHVLAQETVLPGAEGSLRARMQAGNHAVNAMTVGAAAFSVRSGGAASIRVALSPGDGISGVPREVTASDLLLRVTNGFTREVLVRVESADWPDTIATAADVTAMQTFRDLFSGEVLATGLELSIQNLSVLFTDLVGSTAMYAKSGDAPAFRIVNEHFDQMRGVVDKYNGAIVKTIGDAIMAVFRNPGDALEAALRLPGAVGTVQCEGGTGLQLRVGFHSGPCIAMRANDRLDYFGTTVNLAARLEHAAAGGEVVFTEATGGLAPVEAVVRKYDLHPRCERMPLKGFADPVNVRRARAFS